jgi:hypothetical protein
MSRRPNVLIFENHATERPFAF